MDHLLSVESVAEFLGLSPRRVHGLVREKKLACVQVTPRERRFTEDQVQAFIASRTIQPPKPVVDTNALRRVPSPAKTYITKGGKSLSGDLVRALKEEMSAW